MDQCWENIARELLSNIFRHLDYKHMKTEIIRWMATKDVINIIRKSSFEQFVMYKNLTGCILYKKYNPKSSINWVRISRAYKLSSSFIQLYHHKLDWYWLSLNQVLSEKIIENFSHKVDWWNISMKQKMSEEFKLKYSNMIIKRFIRA
jgi:hypothetical protein